MLDGIVELLVDGKTVIGWASMNWKSALSALVDELEVQMPAVVGAGIVGGEHVEVRVDGQGLFDGWADSVEVAASAVEASLSMRCRSKTADVVDSAIDLLYRPSELFSVTLFEVLTEYVWRWIRIPVRNEVADLPIIPKVAVQPGETIFDLIERYARQAGVLLRTAGDGALVIERAGAEQAGARLVLGENLVESNFKVDLTQRFRFTKVIGQGPTEEGFGEEGSSGVSGESIDESIRPTRVTVIQASGPVSAGDCADQASWHAAVSAARSSMCSCSVVGWMGGDAIWRPNTLVDVDLGKYGFEARLLLDSVNLNISAQGGYTGSLELVNLGAYKLEPVRSEESDDVREGLKTTGWAS